MVTTSCGGLAAAGGEVAGAQCELADVEQGVGAAGGGGARVGAVGGVVGSGQGFDGGADDGGAFHIQHSG